MLIEQALEQYEPGHDIDDDDDAELVAEAALDRLSRGEETTISFTEWEQRCNALDG